MSRQAQTQPFQRSSDGRWIGKVRDAEGRWRYVTGTDREVVAARMEALRRSLAAPTSTPGDTLRDYLERWFVQVGPGRYRPKTLRNNLVQSRNHVLPVIGHLAIRDIRPSDVQRVVDGMIATGYAVQTTVNVAHILSVVLRTAEADELISRNPVRLVRLPKRERPVLPSMTAGQLGDLLEASRGEPFWPAWALAFATGIRSGELCGLRWSDWDRSAGTLTIDGQWAFIGGRRRGRMVRVPGKTANSRRVLHLPDLGSEALSVQLAQATSPVHVFAYPDGRPMNPTDLSHRWARTLEAHGLPHVRLHSLRHSAAVTMLDASGGDIVAVSKVLGHSTIAVTVDTYSREADAARQRGASYMNKALRRVK